MSEQNKNQQNSTSEEPTKSVWESFGDSDWAASSGNGYPQEPEDDEEDEDRDEGDDRRRDREDSEDSDSEVDTDEADTDLSEEAKPEESPDTDSDPSETSEGEQGSSEGGQGETSGRPDTGDGPQGEPSIGEPVPEGGMPTAGGAPETPVPGAGAPVAGAPGAAGGAPMAGGAGAGVGATAAPVVEGGGAVAVEGGAAIGAVIIEFLPWILLAIVVIVVAFLCVKAAIYYMSNYKAGSKAPITAVGTSTICLDPGHPSENAGATGEKELVFKLATELKPLLEKAGYKVVMTKSSVDEKVLNADRAQKCADAKADFMYRIHADGSNRSGGYPFHVYPNTNMTNIYDTSKKYTEIIHNKLVEKLGVNTSTSGEVKDGGSCTEKACTGKGTLDGSVKANDLKLPTGLIEAIQLDSKGGSWLDNDTNRKKFVEGIAAGISAAIPKGASGDANAIVAKACELKNDLSLYQRIMLKGITDCYGFVATVVKYVFDEDVAWQNRAKDAVVNYFEKHPEKYQVIRGVKNTSVLLPGDLLFRETGGSHASIFVGKGGCGCPRDAVSASLNSHPPECSLWYPAMSTAVRIK